VIAAAVKTWAPVIVTENPKHFPDDILGPLDREAKSADTLIADIIDLDVGCATPAFRTMREGFSKPAMTPEDLLLRMEASGYTQTVDALREHVLSL
jgi:hypothetical protein